MAKVAKRRGRYVLDYYDNQGIRQRKALKKGTTLKKAKEKLREIEDQLSKGIHLPDNKIPVFSEVAKEWINHKTSNLRDSTWSVYEGHTRNHFQEFDDLKINCITVAMIEKWITDRQAQQMPIGTIRKILVSMGQIFKYAARHRYIPYNPYLDAEKPRADQSEDEDKQESPIRILNPSEINAFIKATEDQKYHTLFRLAIMSGARQGELLGLKWSDVIWKDSQIHIQRTFNNQAWYKPKTKASNRKIDLGPSMMAELKKWKIACPPNNLNLMFPNESGRPINHNNLVNRYYVPALEKAEIEIIRFHDLRHTYASLLIRQGENPKYIQKQMGHSKVSTTLDIYAHLFSKVNQEAACRLENNVFNTGGHKTVTAD
jgi:integrase